MLLLFNQILYSQNSHFTVSGVIFDSVMNQPIEFSSVAIYKLPDTILITGTITNPKGEFALTQLSSGKYVMMSSFVGFQTFYNNVEIKNSSVQLPEPIYMTGSSLSLHEVEVTATQDEKQINIEKTKINVAQNISSVSGNVTDVLKSQPSINIDLENNVYLRGNKNILILIDGVPTTISTLNSIPATGIESIEIITNPDAKYDAEGTGGIINIVTIKQTLSGLSGSANLNYGFTERINGGLGINYSRNLWDFSFNYSGKYEETGVRSNLTRQLYAEDIFIDQEITSAQVNSTQMASMLLSLKPSKKESFSIGIKFVRPNLTNTQNISGHQVNDSVSEEFLRWSSLTGQFFIQS